MISATSGSSEGRKQLTDVEEVVEDDLALGGLETDDSEGVLAVGK